MKRSIIVLGLVTTWLLPWPGARLEAAGAPAASAWPVERATMRLDLEIYEMPSDPRAGVLVIVPDGGILPRPFPEPVVLSVTGQVGRVLKSEVAWYNPNEGLGIVFEAPPKEAYRVKLYLRSANAIAAPFGPRSAFCPGVLLYTKMGPSTLEGAMQMGRTTPPGSDGTMGQVEFMGHRENQWGNDDNYMSYYVGWFRPEKAGQVFLCTVSDEGSEMWLDGKAVASWPGMHTRDGGIKGEHGSWVNLTAEPHKLEYFHFEAGNDFVAETQAAWSFVPLTKENKPQMIPASAFLRSGNARIAKAVYQDGRPVAAFTASVQNYLYLTNFPVYLWHFNVNLDGANSEDTTYTWTIGDGKVTGRSFPWLLETFAPRNLTLVAANKQGMSRCTSPVVAGLAAKSASVNNAEHRRLYREALYAMCKAVPADKSPCARWSPDMWAVFFAVTEPFKDDALIADVFARGRAEVKALPVDERRYLEDLFAEAVRVVDPTNTLKWVDQLEQDDKDRGRKFHWKLAHLDVVLYDQNNTNEARKLAALLPASANTVDEKVLAQIRQGDVERVAGDYEAAVRIYSAAQTRYQESVKTTTTRTAQQQAVSNRLARTKEELKERLASKPSLMQTYRAPPPPAPNWRNFAVRESSYYAEFRNLLQGGFVFEANDVMRTWEMEFPLCKMSGDYPLAEAEYYVAGGRYERALKTLQIYRKGVDISSSMLQALSLELDCLAKLKREAEIVALATEINLRFPNHPLAERARDIIDRAGKEKAKPAAVKAKEAQEAGKDF